MATLNVQCLADADDAFESDSGTGFSLSGNPTVVSSTTTATRQDYGFRFPNVTIPQGTTLTSCVLQLNVASVIADDVLGHFFGEAVNNSVDFNATPHVFSRAKTTANVAWSATNLGAGYKTTPDITSCVQEIINRAGWVSGNALTLMLFGDNSSTSRTISFSTGGSGTWPKLTITYTAVNPQGITVTETQTFSMIRSTGKNITPLTQTQTPTLARVTGKKIVTAIQAQTIVLTRATGKVLSATQTQTTIVSRAIGKIVSVVQTQTSILDAHIGTLVAAGIRVIRATFRKDQRTTFEKDDRVTFHTDGRSTADGS